MDLKNKAVELQQSVDNISNSFLASLARAFNPDSIIIDSINTDGTVTGRYLDGEVTTFNNKNLDPYYEEILDSETNKRFRKLKAESVSQFTQKPVEQLTDEDFNNVANFLQQQTAFSLSQGHFGKRPDGVTDKSVFGFNPQQTEDGTNITELSITTNIDGQDVTLPVVSRNQPTANIHRYNSLINKDPNTLTESELAEKKAIEDIAINDAITAKQQGLSVFRNEDPNQQYNTDERYNEVNVSNLNLLANTNEGYVSRINPHSDIKPIYTQGLSTGEYFSQFLGKSFREGVAGVTTGLLDLVGYYENEEERQVAKSNIVGYVDPRYEVAEREAMRKAYEAYTKGDILEAAWHAKYQILPELAQEAGELVSTALFMSAITVGSGGLAIPAALITGAKLADTVKKAVKASKYFNSFITAPVATSVDQYASSVATYEANNGHQMDLPSRAILMVGLMATNEVDLLLIKEAGKITLGTAKQAVDAIVDPTKKKIAKGALARYATATLGGMGAEGFQEYIQTIFDTAMTQNQADGKTLIEIALDPETHFAGFIGGLVGGSVGFGANAVGDLAIKAPAKIATTSAKAVYNTLKNVMTTNNQGSDTTSTTTEDTARSRILQGIKESFDNSVKSFKEFAKGSKLEGAVNSFIDTLYDIKDSQTAKDILAKGAEIVGTIKNSINTENIEEIKAKFKKLKEDIQNTVFSNNTNKRKAKKAIAQLEQKIINADITKDEDSIKDYLETGDVNEEVSKDLEDIDEVITDIVATRDTESSGHTIVVDDAYFEKFYGKNNTIAETFKEKVQQLKSIQKRIANGSLKVSKKVKDKVNELQKKIKDNLKHNVKAKKNTEYDNDYKSNETKEDRLYFLYHNAENEQQKERILKTAEKDKDLNKLVKKDKKGKRVLTGYRQVEAEATYGKYGWKTYIKELTKLDKAISRINRKKHKTDKDKERLKELEEELSDVAKDIKRFITTQQSKLQQFSDVYANSLKKDSGDILGSVVSTNFNTGEKSSFEVNAFDLNPKNKNLQQKGAKNYGSHIVISRTIATIKGLSQALNNSTIDEETKNSLIDTLEKINISIDSINSTLKAKGFSEDWYHDNIDYDDTQNTSPEATESSTINDNKKQVENTTKEEKTIVEAKKDTTKKKKKKEEKKQEEVIETSKEEEEDITTEINEEESTQDKDVDNSPTKRTIIEYITEALERPDPIFLMTVVDIVFNIANMAGVDLGISQDVITKTNAENHLQIILHNLQKQLGENTQEEIDTYREENTLSEATESSVNEDSEEEVDNTTEEESLVTEPENDDEEQVETSESFTVPEMIKDMVATLSKLTKIDSIKKVFEELLTVDNFNNDTFNKDKSDKVFIGNNYTLDEEDLKGVKYIFINLFFDRYYTNTDKVKGNIETFIKKIEAINKNRKDPIVFVLPTSISKTFKTLFDESEIQHTTKVQVPRAETVKDNNTTDLIVGFQGLEDGYTDKDSSQKVLLSEGTFNSRTGTNTEITKKTITIFSEPDRELVKKEQVELEPLNNIKDSTTKEVIEDLEDNENDYEDRSNRIKNKEGKSGTYELVGSNPAKKIQLYKKKDEDIYVVIKDGIIVDIADNHILVDVIAKPASKLDKIKKWGKIVKDFITDKKKYKGNVESEDVNPDDSTVTGYSVTIEDVEIKQSVKIKLGNVITEYTTVEDSEEFYNDIKDAITVDGSFTVKDSLTKEEREKLKSSDTVIDELDKEIEVYKLLFYLFSKLDAKGFNSLTAVKAYLNNLSGHLDSNMKKVLDKVISDLDIKSNNYTISDEVKDYIVLLPKLIEHIAITIDNKTLKLKEEIRIERKTNVKNNTEKILYSVDPESNNEEDKTYVDTKPLINSSETDRSSLVRKSIFKNLEQDYTTKNVKKQLKRIIFDQNLSEEDFKYILDFLKNVFQIEDKIIKQIKNRRKQGKNKISKIVQKNIDTFTKTLAETIKDTNEGILPEAIREEVEKASTVENKTTYSTDNKNGIALKSSEKSEDYHTNALVTSNKATTLLGYDIVLNINEKWIQQISDILDLVISNPLVYKLKNQLEGKTPTYNNIKQAYEEYKEKEGIKEDISIEALLQSTALYHLFINKYSTDRVKLAIDFAVAQFFMIHNSKFDSKGFLNSSEMIRQLGEDILNALGVTPNPTTLSFLQADKLAIDFGLVAYAYAEQMGYIQTFYTSVPTIHGENKTSVVKRTANKADIKLMRKKYNTLAVAPLKETDSYSFTPHDISVQRRGEQRETAIMRTAAELFAKTPFIPNYEAIKQVLENAYHVKRALGWKTPEEIDALSTYNQKETAKGKNLQIERSIDLLADIMNDAEAEKGDSKNYPKYVYFNTFTAPNGRLHVDSNTINPQNDKLHRFLFSPATTLEGEKIAGETITIDAPVIIKDSTSNDAQYFTYAVGQGLGLPVDKVTNEKRSKWLEIIKENLIKNRDNLNQLKTAILNNDVDSINTIAKTIGLSIEIDNFSHFLQSVYLLENVKIEPDDSIVIPSHVVDTVVVEHDAGSSGITLRQLCSGMFADKNASVLNTSLGIHVQSDNNDKAPSSRNEFHETKKEKETSDVYESAAYNITDLTSKDAKTQIDRIAVLFQYPFSSDYKIETEFYEEILKLADEFVPKVDNGKVSKELRNEIMKEITMPYNYQLGFNNSVKQMSIVLLDSLFTKYDELKTKIEKTKEEQSTYDSIDKFLDKLSEKLDTEAVGKLSFKSKNLLNIYDKEENKEEKKKKKKDLLIAVLAEIPYNKIPLTIPSIDDEGKDTTVNYSLESFFQDTIGYTYIGQVFAGLTDKFGALRGSGSLNSIAVSGSAQIHTAILNKKVQVVSVLDFISNKINALIKKETLNSVDNKLIESIQSSLETLSKRFKSELNINSKDSARTKLQKMKEYIENVTDTINENSDNFLMNLPMNQARKEMKGTITIQKDNGEPQDVVIPINFQYGDNAQQVLEGIEIKRDTFGTNDKYVGIPSNLPVSKSYINFVGRKESAKESSNYTVSDDLRNITGWTRFKYTTKSTPARMAAISIHLLDSLSMAKAIQKMNGGMLPIFDAIVSNPFRSKDSSEVLNQAMLEEALNYNLEKFSLDMLNQYDTAINSLDNILDEIATDEVIKSIITNLGESALNKETLLKNLKSIPVSPYELYTIGAYISSSIFNQKSGDETIEKYRKIYNELKTKQVINRKSLGIEENGKIEEFNIPNYIDRDELKKLLEASQYVVTQQKNNFKEKLTLANVDGIDNTSATLDNKIHGYNYDTAEEGAERENRKFDDYDVTARIDLLDELAENTAIKDSSFFKELKEFLKSLGALRLGKLGVILVDTMNIGGYYESQGHRIVINRSKISSSLSKYSNPAIVYAHELVHAITSAALSSAHRIGAMKELNKLLELYHLAAKHLTIEDFLPEYYTNYNEALKIAEERYKYIFLHKNDADSTKKDYYGLGEFLAYFLTDERLANKLKNIMIQEKNNSRRSLWDKLKEAAKALFNFVRKNSNGETVEGLIDNLVDIFKENKDINAYETLQTLVHKLVQADNKVVKRLQARNSNIDNKETIAERFLYQSERLVGAISEHVVQPFNKTVGGFLDRILTATENEFSPELVNRLLNDIKNADTPRAKTKAISKAVVITLFNTVTSPRARTLLPHILNYLGRPVFTGYSFVGRIYNEIRGTDEYGNIIETAGRIARRIDQNAEQMKNVIINQLTESFKDSKRPNGLSEVEKAMLTDIVLRLDLSCLTKESYGLTWLMNAHDLKKLINNDEEIDNNINKLKKELEAIFNDKSLGLTKENYNLLSNQILLLADYMLTGNTYFSSPLNASDIVSMLQENNSKVPIPESTKMKIAGIVDKLSTLTALRQAPKQHRDTVASFSAEGLSAIINIHRNYGKEVDEIYEEDRFKQYRKVSDNKAKGFVSILSDNTHEMIIGFEDDKDLYTEKGFHIVENAEVGTVNGRKVVYYRDGFRADTNINGGALMSLGYYKLGNADFLARQNKVDNKDSSDLDASVEKEERIKKEQSLYTTNLKKVQKHNLSIMSSKEMSLDELKALHTQHKNIYPVLEDGGTVEFKIMPPQATRELIEERKDAFESLGNMLARNIRNIQGAKANASLLDTVFRESDKVQTAPTTFEDTKNQFMIDENGHKWITISPDSDNPFIKELWKETDSYFKNAVIEHIENNESAVMVREDVLLDMFGQKDIYFHKLISRNRPVLRQAVHLAGMIVEHAAKTWKGLIVIKTPMVLIANIMSNIALALTQGVNPVNIIKWYREDFKNVQKYEKDYREYLAINNRLNWFQTIPFDSDIEGDKLSNRETLDLQARARILWNEIENNPIHPLMIAGYKQNIVEDVESIQDIKGNYIDRKIDAARNAVPSPILSTFDTVFMTRHSAIYKYLFKLTSYSDLLARSVEYRHKTEAINQRYRKGTEQYTKAMDEVHRELVANYINYDKPHSATEEWLNRMGLVAFTKFFKRIQSVIVRMTTKNPLGVATFLLANSVVEAPNIFETSIAVKDLANYVHNPINYLEDLLTPPLMRTFV